MHTLSRFAMAAAIAFSPAPFALANDAHHGASALQSEGVAGQTVDGEVRKVDKEAGKITIRHAELKHMNMPAMTMVFRANDPAMLEKVKAGDKVGFVADKIGGQFTVMQIEVKNQAQSGASD